MLNSLKIAIIIAGTINLIRVLLPFQLVDDELKPYFNEFIGYVEDKCKTGEYYLPRQFIIKFKNKLKNDAVGLCSYTNYRFELSIDKSYWNSHDVDYKYALMFHELSHCVLHMEHVDDKTHYMYRYDTKIDRQTTKKQLISYLEHNCTKGK